MTTPNLLFAVPIEIEPIDKDSTRYSDTRRESSGRIRRKSTITIQAQVKWLSEKDFELKREGIDEDSVGYVIVRTKDMNTLGVNIKRGDKITKLGDQEVDLYVTRYMFGAESSSGSSFGLVRYYFSDRTP